MLGFKQTYATISGTSKYHNDYFLSSIEDTVR